MSTRFSYGLGIVLGHEGGISDRPNDRGGLTNYGVTQKTYDAFCKATGRYPKPVRGITLEEVEMIYGGYWKDAHCSYMPEPLDLLMFDAAINHGAGRAVKLLQQALGVDVDGVCGRQTMEALHEEVVASSIIEVCHLYLEFRRVFFNQIVANDPTQQENYAGWMNRIDHLRELIEE